THHILNPEYYRSQSQSNRIHRCCSHIIYTRYYRLASSTVTIVTFRKCIILPFVSRSLLID
ncbi:hypothetical protein, partial [Leptospira santarosai]|uniref:hypothetical protein n=1 Tax=Leptospira santarosai TaxID=28183 RepID=UPI001E5BA517